MRPTLRITTLALFACLACTPQERAQAEAAGIGAGVCVIQGIVEQGLSDIPAVLAKCAGAEVQTVADATKAWLDAEATSAPEGGTSLSPMRTRVQKVHDDAISSLDGGAK